MIAKTLRGVAAAFLIGTAAVAVAGTATISVAQAAGVRPAVGNALKDAIALAKQGKSRAALAKIRQAESVKHLTATERRTIAKTKEYVQAKTGNFSGGVTNRAAAQAKFAADYNARRYRAVISTDAALLRKYGAFDFKSKLIVAQAYYLSGNYRGAIRYLNGLGDSDTVLSLKMAAAAKIGDTDAQRQAAERLVLKGQSKYWPYLLSAADNTRGLSDEETLGVFRIRFLTGHMRSADDYSNATQLAILLGLPQEGAAIEQKGFDDKVLSDQRQQRLLQQAKMRAAQQAKQMDQIAKQAHSAKTGDRLVKLGEIYWGIGRYQDAVDAVQAGLKRGVKDENHAQIVLGMAYTGLKQRSRAVRAFAKVKNDPKAQVVARLWSVYARTK
jgi:tetratricopeptide (TPR) repeat protein